MCTSGSQARQGLLAAASNQLMRRILSSWALRTLSAAFMPICQSAVCRNRIPNPLCGYLSFKSSEIDASTSLSLATVSAAPALAPASSTSTMNRNSIPAANRVISLT